MVDGTTALSAVTTGPNSSTVTSSKYGTVQSDGRMYYYTTIKGSKPIKDPRIGAHFGSQRHKCKSFQLLEQETATHGNNVYSIDGREWMRASQGSGETLEIQNESSGCRLVGNGANVFLEFTGYFRDVNYIGFTYTTDNRSFTVTLDGTTGSEVNTFMAAATPLSGRYVDAGNILNLALSTTLGIHTIKIQCHSSSDWLNFYGIELIAQDTTSATTRSQIQIPSQNVVSYGKKFTVSGTPHYDPFNGFTNSTSLHSAYVDTATSLGLSTGTLHGATWAISGSNNIRPYNGGRVVKWVDSAGVIKTSVNMMPPNAQNIGTTASAEITTPSATNTAYLPAFSDDAVDHSLAEVAKTYSAREFGNGAANGGTGATYADASMLTSTNTADDIAYVMDDGLTSLSGDDVACPTEHAGAGILPYATDDSYFLTFIGTGISLTAKQWGAGVHHIAQNLPYGTHILKGLRDADTHPDFTIDGVSLADVSIGTYANFIEVSFHQPKMPPIPEDAVVIADYMLMADFVGVSGTTGGIEAISKGTRWLSPSRDVFVDENTNDSIGYTWSYPLARGGMYMGMTSGNISSGTAYIQVPYFGTTVDVLPYADRFAAITEPVNSTSLTVTSVSTTTWSGRQRATGQTLGVNGIKATQTSGNMTILGFEIHSPIHTSSHYQTFETPFLHELVGGDRNMEQTNLVVTPDGKTWDEVTRDVSYMGPSTQLSCSRDGGHISGSNPFIWDLYRGKVVYPFFNKNIAIAYDRFIILEDGIYEINVHFYANSTDFGFYVYQNVTSGGGTVGVYNRTDPSDTEADQNIIWDMKRGDYVYINIESGQAHATASQSSALTITKLN